MGQFNAGMQFRLYMTFPELLKRETDEPNMKIAIVILNSKQIPGHSVCGCWVLQAIHSEDFPTLHNSVQSSDR